MHGKRVQNYLGIAVAGFPNFFTITGPGSPSVLTNMLPSIAHHVELVSDILNSAREQKKPVIEVEPDAQFAWTKHVNEIANGTLYPRCISWYLGANILGKPQVFMPYKGFAAYVAKCNNIKATGFRGFKFSD